MFHDLTPAELSILSDLCADAADHPHNQVTDVCTLRALADKLAAMAVMAAVANPCDNLPPARKPDGGSR